MMRIAVSIGLIALPALLAGQDRSSQVDQYLRSEMASRKIPGLGLAVVRGGRVEKATSYGMANLELGIPVSDSTVFQINSTTKSFASVAVLMLAEAGKFRLDDPIGDHLDSLPAAWRPATIRQLLNHTSGLPDVIDNPTTGTLLARNVPDALTLLAPKPMMFARGTQWSYNQTNYMLLAMLIEKKAGMTFPEFCLERELRPLGITRAAFGDSRHVIPGRASGYTKISTAGGKVAMLPAVQNTWYEFEPFLYTGAGLHLSAADFGRWVAALLQGKLISRKSLEEIWTPTKLADGTVFRLGGALGYGLGWPLLDRPRHRAAGGSGGARAAFFVYPEDDLAVVVLTNLQGAGPEALVEGVAAIYLPDLKSGGSPP
jgi:CubicO group peptidase (beta-lactamase class C family)